MELFEEIRREYAHGVIRVSFSLRGRDYLPKTLSSRRICLPNLKPWYAR